MWLLYLNKKGYILIKMISSSKLTKTKMWANAQRDGRPAEYRWRPLFNAAKVD